jgi:superfamily I DNA/RNA helicase
MRYYAGSVDMVAPNAPAAAGPKPTLVRAGSAEAELRLVAEQATRASRTQAVAVIARTVRQLDRIRPYLPSTATTLRSDALHWVDGPGLYYGTFHSAKGLEFDVAILPFLSAVEFPDPTYMADFGEHEAEAYDGRLLYVGVTRARRALILTYTGEVTPLLPADPNLYAVVDD